MPKAKSDKPEKSTDKSKGKDGKPKRALSAYMYFANDKRDQVRKEDPSLTFGAVGKKLGADWKALDAKSREVCYFCSLSVGE